jgi:uncharacterized membrane protein
LQDQPGERDRRLAELNRQDRRREEVFSELEQQTSTAQGVAEIERQLAELDLQDQTTGTLRDRRSGLRQLPPIVVPTSPEPAQQTVAQQPEDLLTSILEGLPGVRTRR